MEFDPRKLKSQLSLAGLNQAKLARLLNITPSVISDYVMGRANISDKQIKRFAEAIGCNPQDLCAGNPKHELTDAEVVSYLISIPRKRRRDIIALVTNIAAKQNQ